MSLGYLVDPRMRTVIAEIERFTDDPTLRLAWSLIVGRKLAAAIEQNRGDEALDAVLREIREHLPAIAMRKPSRRPPSPKPAKPGPGYHRERLDTLRASVGLPVEPPRAWPWGPTRPYKRRSTSRSNNVQPQEGSLSR